MEFQKRMILSMAAGLALIGLLAAPKALAQQNEKATRLSFQTASIKSSEGEGRCAPNAAVGPTFKLTNCPLGELILFAYDVPQEQVSGQTALLGEEYDITAKVEHAANRGEMRRMMQTLLEDRFKLKLRRETKEIAVYALVVGKDGPKFPHSKTTSEEGIKPVSGSPGQLTLQNMEMSDLVFALSRRIKDRTIVDKTELEGKFDIEMTWYVSLGKPNPPSVFTAVQETGLKLEPQQSKVEFLVVDHVALPSGN
jgi:uncharacterized protein (TIGR03435 family)